MVNLSSFEKEYFSEDFYSDHKVLFCFDKTNLSGDREKKVFASHFPFKFHLQNKKGRVDLIFDEFLACKKSPNPISIIIPHCRDQQVFLQLLLLLLLFLSVWQRGKVGLRFIVLNCLLMLGHQDHQHAPNV